MITIIASTDSCERKFSTMKNKKTCLPTRLTNQALDILRNSIDGTAFKDFDPKPYVQSWLNTKDTEKRRGSMKIEIQKK